MASKKKVVKKSAMASGSNTSFRKRLVIARMMGI